jgi:ATP-dependent DNA helicase PIF1
MVLAGRSVCITGRAGCGKSYLVRALVQEVRRLHGARLVFVTASTGVAACTIGGTTLHSFAGVGLGDNAVAHLITKARRHKGVLRRWKRARVLFIDEISMVDGLWFSKLEAMARGLRGSDAVWGGIQLVLVGDFFQLPPVSRRDEPRKPFAFEAPCWNTLIPPHAVVDLRQQMRQSKDTTLADLLNHVRVAKTWGPIGSTMGKAFAGGGTALAALRAQGMVPTRLFAHNKVVAAWNTAALAAVEGEPRTWVAVDTGDKRAQAQLDSSCLAEREVVLKVGAQVMLLRNLRTEQGLCNGVQGVVEGWARDEHGNVWPRVRFRTASGTSCMQVVHTSTWDITRGHEVLATRKQVPLKLAYAISIHKSQSMTLPALHVDLRGVFEAGQAYVALSRGTSLATMQVDNFAADAVFCDKKVLQFYFHIAQAHAVAAAAVEAEDSAMV